MKRVNSVTRRGLRTDLCNAFGGRCAYCRTVIGMRGTVDHYMPEALGGSNRRSNLRWCCLSCNGLKRDMHPTEWERVRPRPIERETPAEARARLHRLIALRARGIKESPTMNTPAPPLAAVSITITATPVTEGMPDADTDVLIFDAEHEEGQLGAYTGHDEHGPIWTDAQGSLVLGVTHWADMPKLKREVTA